MFCAGILYSVSVLWLNEHKCPVLKSTQQNSCIQSRKLANAQDLGIIYQTTSDMQLVNNFNGMGDCGDVTVVSLCLNLQWTNRLCISFLRVLCLPLIHSPSFIFKSSSSFVMLSSFFLYHFGEFCLLGRISLLKFSLFPTLCQVTTIALWYEPCIDYNM